MMTFPQHTVYGGSYTGRRQNNEDTAYPLTTETANHYYIVCDGMGGHSNGKLASMTACKNIAHCLASIDSKETAAQQINDAYRQAGEALSDLYPTKGIMGTTALTIVLVENACYLANIGDSRAYVFRNGKEIHRTRDDSYVHDLVEKGILSQKQAHEHPKKNIVTRSLSSKPMNNNTPKPSLIETITPADRILICTDGVWDCFPQGDPAKLFDINNDLKTIHRKIMQLCSQLNRDNYSFFLLGDFLPV